MSRRALITGSTRNIGLAIAERLARDGWIPILNHARNCDGASIALRSLQKLCPETELIRADITQEKDVVRMIDDASKAGPIDLLVNNAGAFLLKPFLATSLDEWNQIIASNLTSTFLCCRAILPLMRARGKGLIVNIASMHADRRRATPNTLPYAIAKAGVSLLTRTLAKTEGSYGIRVNAISPGFVDTGENLPSSDAAAEIPLGRIAQPSDIAAAVAFFASNDAAYVTGSNLEVHGGALL